MNKTEELNDELKNMLIKQAGLTLSLAESAGRWRRWCVIKDGQIKRLRDQYKRRGLVIYGVHKVIARRNAMIDELQHELKEARGWQEMNVGITVIQEEEE